MIHQQIDLFLPLLFLTCCKFSPLCPLDIFVKFLYHVNGQLQLLFFGIPNQVNDSFSQIQALILLSSFEIQSQLP